MRLLIEAANAAVGVEDGRIVPTAGAFDVMLRIPGGELRPGLINAHEHLHRNHYGRLGTPPYADAYAWGRDIHVRHADAITRGRALPRRDALLLGAWKNLFAGVTTVVHHDRWEPAFEAGFPLRVARVRCLHAPGLEPDLRAATGHGPLAIHLAEGTNAAAADEVREIAGLGLLTADLLAVHAVGVDADGIARLRAAGAAVVWCPTSNLFLLGRTAPAALLDAGGDVLLGSDSLLTADGTLLDELRAARRLGPLTDARLLDAVGPLAARRLALEEPCLEPGARADLAVFRRTLLEAEPEDVALVVAGGIIRVLDLRLVPALGTHAARGTKRAERGVLRWVDPRTAPRPAQRPARRSTCQARRS